MLETALLDVRVLPWRVRARVMRPDVLRENVDPLMAVDDLSGVIFGLVLWIVILTAAPLIVLILAALLFSIELPIVLLLAVLLVIVRFTGVVPWTVVIINNVNRSETTESYRNIFRAVRRIREINGDRKVHVRWAWTANPKTPRDEPAES
ncbi:MAG: hypothetical protein ACTHJM_01415 [Marmoricola sp.]